MCLFSYYVGFYKIKELQSFENNFKGMSLDILFVASYFELLMKSLKIQSC